VTGAGDATPPLPDRPVRVMHLVYSLGMGGMELGIVKIVNGADRTRVESSVCSCHAMTLARARVADHVKLFAMDRPDGNDLSLIRQLVRLFRAERPDIVHTHAWGTLCEGVMAARWAGVPFVVHGEHGTMEARPRNLWVQRRVWRRVDRVLAVSSRLAERMAAAVRFPIDRITVIRNGVDLARFAHPNRAAARARLGITAEATIVGTVGRLVPVKHQHNLLAAMARVKAQGIRAQTVLAGDGPLRDDLERTARALDLEADVRFLGETGDVASVLAAFDVFALPSRSEGMSNTILEAMACGLPVVATRVGGNDELVADGVTGKLVPAESAEALADALGGLISDPAGRHALGAAGRARVEREFSLEAMIRGYERLYEDVVRGGAHADPHARPTPHAPSAAAAPAGAAGILTQP
jgi:sugar transferase (PEP-CTERM/EpsH1 system associated)